MWTDVVGKKHGTKFKRVYTAEGEPLTLGKQSSRQLIFDHNEEPQLSLRYKDPSIQLLDDGLTAVGYKGWASIFGSHCARTGKWYYEVTVKDDYKNIDFIGRNPGVPESTRGHVRVGYACRYQRYGMPVGQGNFGFALSDVDGAVVNGGTKTRYAKPFGRGDVVGCYLSLESSTTEMEDPRKDPKLHLYLQRGVLCDPQNPPPMELNPGSYVAFSINGESFGRCQLRVWNGSYHPAVALYMGATVTVNFGPDFRYPPADFAPCTGMRRPEVV